MTAIDRMVAVACEKVMGNLRGQESIETFNRAMEVLRLSMINAYVEKTPACRPKDPPIPTSPCVPESKKPKKGEKR